jgi:TonB family protein
MFPRCWSLVLLLMGTAVSLTWSDEPGPDTGRQVTGMPHLDHLPPLDFYPPRARLTGDQGRVLVGFNITASGAAENISVIWAENGVFSAEAVRMLNVSHFKVPSDWATTGAGRRWRLGITWCLPPSGQSDRFGITPLDTILIKSSRIRPLYAKPPKADPSLTGPCAQP